MSNGDAPRAGIEWNAAVYHQVADPQYAWGLRVLDRLSLRGDETALDAGCGSGRLTTALLERLPRGHVIAVDRSENMLQVARDYLTPRFGARVSFVPADLLNLALPAAVDLIFSTATFHWIPDHDTLFRCLYRTLRPGGRLVAQCGGGPNLAQTLGRAATLLAAEPFAPYVAGWQGPWLFADATTTAQRLRAAGFVAVETSLEEAPTVLPDAAAYRAFVSTVIFRLHLERLPDEHLRRAFLDGLVAQGAATDPPFMLDYWRLNLQATRPARTG